MPHWDLLHSWFFKKHNSFVLNLVSHLSGSFKNTVLVVTATPLPFFVELNATKLDVTRPAKLFSILNVSPTFAEIMVRWNLALSTQNSHTHHESQSPDKSTDAPLLPYANALSLIMVASHIQRACAERLLQNNECPMSVSLPFFLTKLRIIRTEIVSNIFKGGFSFLVNFFSARWS